MEFVCPILGRPTEVIPTGFGRDAWSLVQCRETGFVFLPNPPAYAALDQEYAWERTMPAERIRREATEPTLSRLSHIAKNVKRLFPRRHKIFSLALRAARDKFPQKELHILDIGCGDGDPLRELHLLFAGRGWKVVPVGIEVSTFLASIVADRLLPIGGKAITASAADGIAGLAEESIHIAIMSSFLEHECRPLDLLQRLHRVLVPEGAVIVKVPNFACWNRIVRGNKWCGFRFPDHVNFFTPRTLQLLAAQAGYSVSRQRAFDRFPLSDNMYAVLTKQSG
jgi:SAM-dependent methyltransferase